MWLSQEFRGHEWSTTREITGVRQAVFFRTLFFGEPHGRRVLGIPYVINYVKLHVKQPLRSGLYLFSVFSRLTFD